MPKTHRIESIIRRSKQDIIAAFKAYPAGATQLDLGFCDIYRRPDIIQCLPKIPPNITAVDIRVNQLGKLSGKVIGDFLAAFPKSVATLNISANNLCKRSAVELKQALKRLSPGLTHINISGNGLGLKGNGAAFVLKGIPNTVTTLYLQNNKFEKCSVATIKRVFGAIPESVKTVYLDVALIKGLGKRLGSLATVANMLNSYGKDFIIEGDDPIIEELRSHTLALKSQINAKLLDVFGMFQSFEPNVLPLISDYAIHPITSVPNQES